MNTIVVTGSFDNLQSRHVRFLQEAARCGRVEVFLWPDHATEQLEGRAPRFPVEERFYFLNAIRFVDRVTLVEPPIEQDTLPLARVKFPAMWIVDPASDNRAKRTWCRNHGIAYRVLQEAALSGFPTIPRKEKTELPANKKVIVTGCYDWLHSGHIRFFEEISTWGDLFVVVGHDANIRLLKGQGHPLFSANERRYMVGSIRYVTEALISSGNGWLDAEPEIERIQPDFYAVNEDGDQLEKRSYCRAHGIEYLVLKRIPKEGLPARQSTDLRGF
ncbi:MAG: adenylyltransferase/cytidyltransferase family protein [Pirellulales bacterium]|nr:adenylyltransferase/cytidyltransferase family protein [Pirellulales bacterium]